MPRATQGTARSSRVFGYAPLTLYGVIFQPLHLTSDVPHCSPTTPGNKSPGLACSRFARHYSGNRSLFLFLRILRCFTSPRLALPVLWIQTGVNRLPGWGFPIRKSPLNSACLPLSEAYRNLLRPSSPSGAKASTNCSL